MCGLVEKALGTESNAWRNNSILSGGKRGLISNTVEAGVVSGGVDEVAAGRSGSGSGLVEGTVMGADETILVVMGNVASYGEI